MGSGISPAIFIYDELSKIEKGFQILSKENIGSCQNEI